MEVETNIQELELLNPGSDEHEVRSSIAEANVEIRNLKAALAGEADPEKYRLLHQQLLAQHQRLSDLRKKELALIQASPPSPISPLIPRGQVRPCNCQQPSQLNQHNQPQWNQTRSTTACAAG
jgi:hypothetical protein